jgi:hypothetical protein
MLTQENVEKLNHFMETTGALAGLDTAQAQAVIVDLLYTVDVIVEEHSIERLDMQLACPQ